MPRKSAEELSMTGICPNCANDGILDEETGICERCIKIINEETKRVDDDEEEDD